GITASFAADEARPADERRTGVDRGDRQRGCAAARSGYQGIVRLVCLRPISAISAPPRPAELILTPSSIFCFTVSVVMLSRNAMPAACVAANTRFRAAVISAG